MQPVKASSPALKHKRVSFVSHRTPSLSQLGNKLLTTTASAQTLLKHSSQEALAQINHAMHKSPAFRVFVYTSATLSLLPLSFFGVWVGLTLLGTVLSAVVGALFVEGGLVLVGLSILVPVEGCILAMAGATALTYASGGIGMRFLDSMGRRLGHLSHRTIESSPVFGKKSRHRSLTTLSIKEEAQLAMEEEIVRVQEVQPNGRVSSPLRRAKSPVSPSHKSESKRMDRLYRKKSRS